MRILCIILTLVLFQFCKRKSSAVSETASNDSAKFFQISDYIQSQINNVNNTPYYIYKLTIESDKRDSTTITNEETALLAKHFIQPDLNDLSIKKYYNETVFFDQTTKNYSINYSTTNKDLILQNVDILLQEDGKTVKRIFLRKFYNYSDSSAMEQLSWKPNESFHINRLVQLPSKQEISRQISVVWNEKGKQL